MILLALTPALACGPDYPPYLLSLPMDDALEPPVGDFDRLIAPLVPPSALPGPVSWTVKHSRSPSAAGIRSAV